MDERRDGCATSNDEARLKSKTQILCYQQESHKHAKARFRQEQRIVVCLHRGVIVKGYRVISRAETYVVVLVIPNELSHIHAKSPGGLRGFILGSLTRLVLDLSCNGHRV